MFALHEGFDTGIMPIVHTPELPDRAAVMGEAAAPDVPAAVGWMISGSGLIDQSQKMTVAAMQIADMNV